MWTTQTSTRYVWEAEPGVPEPGVQILNIDYINIQDFA